MGHPDLWLDEALAVEVFEEALDYGEALAGCVCEAFAVDDVDLAAAVPDDATALKAAGGEGDGGAAGADHVGEDLLGELHGGAFEPVGDHEQPAGETLFNLVKAVAGGELGGDEGLVLDVAEDQAAEGLVALEVLLKALEVHAKGGAFDLHEAAGLAGLGAEHVKRLGEAVAIDDADLNVLAAAKGGDEGGHAGGHEVDVAGSFADLIEWGTKGKGDGLDEREQVRLFAGREGLDQPIGEWGRRGGRAVVPREIRKGSPPTCSEHRLRWSLYGTGSISTILIGPRFLCSMPYIQLKIRRLRALRDGHGRPVGLFRPG